MALLNDFKLDGEWLKTASNVVLRGVVGYYGRSRGIGEGLSDTLEIPRRKVINKGWKRSRNAPNAQLYADWSSGGHTVEHVFRVAMASLVDQIRKALVMLEDFPVKVVARAALSPNMLVLGVPGAPISMEVSACCELIGCGLGYGGFLVIYV